MPVASPPIRIDREGNWYYRGQIMSRLDIVNHFSRHMVLDDNGNYCITLGNDRCPVEVEDAPFVIRSIMKERGKGTRRDTLTAVMTDGTAERIHPDTITVGPGNVPYCTVRNGTMTARFSRPGYYQLAAFIEYDNAKDAYYIPLNRERYYISTEEQ